jgi:hypothetical protein
MSKALDAISVILLLGAVAAFVFGASALGDQKDLVALYWILVGGLALRSATDLLRPRSGSR